MKTSEEARERGFAIGARRGWQVRQAVDEHVEEDNRGLAREAEETFWSSIEEGSRKLAQKLAGNGRHVVTFNATGDTVRLKGQQSLDALLAGFKDGARAGFEHGHPQGLSPKQEAELERRSQGRR